MADRLVLVGMMGSGKSTVGRQLASRLGWAFLDSDAMVEASTGSTVAELFDSGGEASFRDEESRVLAEALASSRPAVVSAAGGSVLSEANRAMLATQASRTGPRSRARGRSRPMTRRLASDSTSRLLTR